jgi:hypothetical protein
VCWRLTAFASRTRHLVAPEGYRFRTIQRPALTVFLLRLSRPGEIENAVEVVLPVNFEHDSTGVRTIQQYALYAGREWAALFP